MSDYTPTTEEIFHCYQFCSIMETPESAHEAEPQFDRWLESIMQKAHIAERERIIKLLEEEISEWLSHDGTCDCRIRGEEGKRLLSLIKGENK